MAWSKNEFRERYGRLAGFYDPGMGLYRAIGMRIGAYRRQAVAGLQLAAGDTVVDLGCGTGLNLSILRNAVGPSGHVVGVDLTPEMLEQAERRIQRAGWHNVTLVEADMTAYRLPAETDAVLATLALATIADYDTVVANAAQALGPDGRLANFEMQWPERWPTWLARFGAWLNRPAGVTLDIVHRRPADAIARHFAAVDTREVYFGAAYICIASNPR